MGPGRGPPWWWARFFSRETQAIFYNWKANPVQRMLDFDFVAGAPAGLRPSLVRQLGCGRPASGPAASLTRALRGF